MINRLLKWSIIQAKLNLRRTSFYLMTFLLILGFWLTDEMNRNYGDRVAIPICVNDNLTGKIVVDKLMSSPPDGFVFSEVSEDEVVRQVIKGEVSCGIVFGGEDEPIIIYQLSDSVNGYVAKEIIYPLLQFAGAKEWLNDYLINMRVINNDGQILPTDEAISYVNARYSDYLDNMDMNIYTLKDIDETIYVDNYTDDRENAKTKTIMRVILCIVILFFIILDVMEEDRGFYKAFKKADVNLFRFSKVMICMVMTTVFSALVCEVIEWIVRINLI